MRAFVSQDLQSKMMEEHHIKDYMVGSGTDHL